MKPITNQISRRLGGLVTVVVLLSARLTGAADTSAWEAARFKTSGFFNLTPGAVGEQHHVPDHSVVGLVPEADLELTPQTRFFGTTVATRVTLNASGIWLESQDTWEASVGEASLFVIGRFGRFEIGERAGFPQTLLGYATSEIAFTQAEFGPESGRRLDPSGRLPTAFLSGDLARRLDAVAYLGYAIRFYDNRSPKLIYVSPRFKGLYGAVSYAPRTEKPSEIIVARSRRLPAAPGDTFGPISSALKFDHLLQSALAYQHRSELADLALGLTYAFATPTDDDAATGDVSSLSGGVTATIQDTWTLGASATYDGLSQHGALGAQLPANPFGTVASINYVAGAWIFGGYYQYASGVSAAEVPGRDRVQIVEIGLSYLLGDHDYFGDGYHTDIKLFGSTYYYDLNNDRAGSDQASHGYVFLAGGRFSFF